jgi:hypothetical protein
MMMCYADVAITHGLLCIGLPLLVRMSRHFAL